MCGSIRYSRRPAQQSAGDPDQPGTRDFLRRRFLYCFHPLDIDPTTTTPCHALKPSSQPAGNRNRWCMRLDGAESGR